jgi:formylglycine-generating enzyme required for sulfatase activity
VIQRATSGHEQLPVEQVSWEDAQTFLKKRSELPAEAKTGRKYRLPTEAESEYACRARTTSPCHFGNTLCSTQANFDGNSPYGGARKGPHLKRTCPVGSYPPNAWGLYDLHGNVYQWCADWYDKDHYATSPGKDARGPAQGTSRVFRGGGWDSLGRYCRSACRSTYYPGLRDSYLGFRVVLLPPGG